MNFEEKKVNRKMRTKQTQTSPMISHRLGKVAAVIPQDRKVDDVDTAETELQVGQCPRHNADRWRQRTRNT